MQNPFKEIFSKYDSNKQDEYDEAYWHSFKSIRDDVKLIFEIGVFNGGSVKGWKDFFPNAIVVGIDIRPETFFVDPDNRIFIEIGNATDPEFVKSLLAKYGDPDIVIDDGSHLSSDMKAAYNLLYGNTKICYAIEDYGVQFKEFSNGHFINDGVSATCIAHTHVDNLLYQKNSTVKTIKFYHSICLIFKIFI